MDAQENQDKTAKTKSPPEYKEGNVSVFSRILPDAKLYIVVDGRDSDQSSRTGIYGKVGKYNLTPKQAYDIYMGRDVKVSMVNDKGKTYEATVAMREITVEKKQVGEKIFENRNMNVGLALNLLAKETGQHFGYLVDGVQFYRQVGPKNNRVELSARDCMQLLKDKAIDRDGVKIELLGIETEGERKKAKVNCEFKASQKLNEVEENNSVKI